MFRKAPDLKRFLFFILLTIPPLFSHPPAAASGEGPLVLGIFPRRSATETVRMFRPLASYLSDRLGREVTVETSKDLPAFWRDLEAGRFDIVHFNQYHYLRARRDLGYQAVARVREFGRETMAGALYVRKDSGITSVGDLKGRKVVFGGGRMAMICHIAAKSILFREGLREGDFEEEFAKNTPNAMMAVYYRQSDAAGVADTAEQFPELRDGIHMDELRPLASSEQLYNVLFAVRGDMPAGERERIRESLLGLSRTAEGTPILSECQIDSFLAATDGDYDSHRAMIREVLGEDF